MANGEFPEHPVAVRYRPFPIKNALAFGGGEVKNTAQFMLFTHDHGIEIGFRDPEQSGVGALAHIFAQFAPRCVGLKQSPSLHIRVFGINRSGDAGVGYIERIGLAIRQDGAEQLYSGVGEMGVADPVGEDMPVMKAALVFHHIHRDSLALMAQGDLVEHHIIRADDGAVIHRYVYAASGDHFPHPEFAPDVVGVGEIEQVVGVPGVDESAQRLRRSGGRGGGACGGGGRDGGGLRRSGGRGHGRGAGRRERDHLACIIHFREDYRVKIRLGQHGGGKARQDKGPFALIKSQRGAAGDTLYRAAA